MPTKYTTSINIDRDFDKDIKYIPTVNAENIYNQLINYFEEGVHSFNIIGSYGTGKSSFILGFEKHLKGEKQYFSDSIGSFREQNRFYFLNVVGEYKSLEKAIQEQFGQSNKTALELLGDLYSNVTKQQKMLIFVVDEFGKFLEYASRNNPEKELYFIQQLAEFINDIDKKALFITTLHQDFSTYSNFLNIAQKREWDKVRGRFKELAFNEPIEQLLFLAAEFIEGEKDIEDKTTFNQLFNVIKEANIVSLADSINRTIAKKLYPLDLLSAAVLTLALQRYGQNERSLFSFLYSESEYSLKKAIRQRNFFSLSDVFDYLTTNFYSLLNTATLNPDSQQWGGVRSSIERVEYHWNEQIDDAVKVLKTIGLLNIFSSYRNSISRDFLTSYAKLSLNIPNATALIKELEERKIIRYAAYRSQYVLQASTDLDINKEIEEAKSHIDKSTDIIQKLKDSVSFPFIPAKAVQYETGTPRFFEFVVSEKPIIQIPTGEIDGFINLIFNSDITEIQVEEVSAKQEEAILFALFKNSSEIIEIIFKIDQINFVLQKTETDDRVAITELKNELRHEKANLNSHIKDRLFNNKQVSWYFKGTKINIGSKTQFNKFLSTICRKIYSKTAIYRNESVNKHKISSTISTARKKFFNALIYNWNKENIGIEKFPPEKAVYLTLLKNTGIHKKENDFWFLTKVDKKSGFTDIWQACEKFLELAKEQKRSLTELIDLLTKRPYKLKQGLIDFWLPVFLFIKRNDFALFYENAYVPSITSDVIDLIYRSVKDFAIKTYSIEGPKLELYNQYRRLINLNKAEEATQEGLIATVKPFLLFYKDLPEYTKQTRTLSKNALRLRDAMAKATEPSATFFDEFPSALGFTDLDLKEEEQALDLYMVYLQDAIRELRSCYSDYIEHIEKKMLHELGIKTQSFSEYKKIIIKRYKPIKTDLLSQKTKIFLNRLKAPVEDRNAWFDSIVQVLIKKELNQIRDHEKNILTEKLTDMFRELDNLVPLHKAKTQNNKDQIIKFDITTPKGTRTNQLIISENKQKKINNLKMKILTLIQQETDDLVQKAAMVEILQKKIKDE